MSLIDKLKLSRPLWGHQRNACIRFEKEPEIALLHDMGVGKTTTAIVWMRCKYFYAQDVVPTLIVSPIATLHNWLEEIVRNCPERVSSQAVVVEGGPKKKETILKDTDAKIFIVNPEIFTSVTLAALLKKKNFKVVIVDEAHKFKNPKSKRLAGLLYISDFADSRALLTGTPILNTYLDVWALWRILDGGATFGMNFFTFRERYFRDGNIAWKGKPAYFPNYVPKPGIEEELSAMIDRKASRVKKSECLTLPPLVEMRENVELSAEQSVAYQEMKDELITYVSSGECVATNALTRVLRMLQILTGYVQVQESETWNGRHLLKDNPRLTRLKELLEELTPNHKVIVWCVFQENYDQIIAVCKALNVGHTELTGRTKDRQAEIKKFELDPACRVMVSNPQAGGVGVNMVAASYSIYYSRSYSLGDRLQSEARNYRGGSERHPCITLIDLVAPGTLDEIVWAALQRKEDFSNNILDRLREIR